MRKFIVLLVLGAALAACGDREYEAQEAPPPDTAGGRPDLSRPDAGPRVLTTLTDTAITNSQDSVQMIGSGQITFVVKNSSSKAGNFKIDGGALGQWSSPLPDSATVFMSMLLGRGSYEMLWPEDGSGIKKIFTVY
jgi:hypothetical protein